MHVPHEPAQLAALIFCEVSLARSLARTVRALGDQPHAYRATAERLRRESMSRARVLKAEMVAA